MENKILPTNDFNIPEITDEKILDIYSKIKLVNVTDDSIRLVKIDESNIKSFRNAFNYHLQYEEDSSDYSNIEMFVAVYFYSSSYPLFWKPKIEEVFGVVQDNENILNNACAFSVEFVAMHDKGKGNIGLATFYKKKG